MPREKSRYRDRDRRSSSYNSDSSHERKKSKSKHRRSRSRDRSESSTYKKKRSSSRSKHKRRSASRSVSRERYEKRRRSSSRGRHRRDRSRSRSSSSSKASKRYKSSKKSRRRSRSSSSRSSSFDIERPLPSKIINLDDTETKIEKAIKAAQAAGLTLTKIPTYEYKEVEIREDMPTIQDRNLLAELNSDSFVQKPFVSKRKESKNIVIDLNTETVKVPETEVKQKDESIINFDELPSEEELKEMWIKKLYQFRKRMLKGEI